MGAVVLVGVVATLLTVFWFLQDRLWPSCSEWELTASFLEETRRGKETLFWVSPDEQKENDYFCLDMRKRREYGRDRVFQEITFLQGTGHTLDYPKEWKVTIDSEHGPVCEFNTIEEYAGRGITIKFDKPCKVSFICVTCVKPRAGHRWAMGNIRIREVRFPIRLPCWINDTTADKL
ncbi:MAG: hypothetical protein WB588_07025 [Dehalococcoidia bacterium]